ncbi:DUF2971 domain-containing protein [Paraburkholderia edwinii]|uniref:DUF2971 domain-containing protein n=1 Tax=Paraburkholderia edwinii TaxID=2861782 RepID=A0ABX8UM68_9BURK|nr:DUF2971 domain-containing protein [Paraburkholderia edwinii]QYD70080.1 DUF2971 domain-containing protein [Paraburkholderia edwinii]
MTEHFYRYRSTKAILSDFRELENQEIFFSETEKLNDPMEGFKDLFWVGDIIVWKNLLRHYILCLLQSATYCFVAGDKFDPGAINNIVFWVPNTLPDAPIRDIYKNVSNKFLGEPITKKFLSFVSNKDAPIRRNELTSYLRSLHGFAVEIAIKEFRIRGLFPFQSNIKKSWKNDSLTRNFLKMMKGVSDVGNSKHPSENVAETIFSISEATLAQAALINEYNTPDREKKAPFMFWASKFPAAYVAALDRLVHRDWYVACFTKTAKNHSMWSTYADGHRGVCLMFKAEINSNGHQALTLERIVGAHGSKNGPTGYSKGNVLHEFQAVQYTGNYPAIDFFRSLGSISQQHMNDFWYKGDDGSFSKCKDAVYADAESWRNGYWQTFNESALYKTPEWAHEEEYRLIVHSGFDLKESGSRRLKYRFEDLTGIVFGARTEMKDKLEIMRIIDEKCAITKRENFRFYEIRYLHTESKFQLCSLDLIKIRHA